MDETSLRFPGRYELVPARCVDPTAEVPARGTLVLEPRGELVRIFVASRDTAGVERWATYGGALDGVAHPDPQPPTTHARYTIVDPDTLDVEALAGSRVVRARRHRLRDGGAELEVVTETTSDDGTVTRSVYVYTRVEV